MPVFPTSVLKSPLSIFEKQPFGRDLLHWDPVAAMQALLGAVRLFFPTGPVMFGLVSQPSSGLDSRCVYLFPTLHSVLLVGELEICLGGNMYTTEIGKTHISFCPQRCHCLNIYQDTTSQGSPHSPGVNMALFIGSSPCICVWE